MSKLSLTPILIVVVCGVIGWLAFDPTAARDAANWIQHQIGNDIPDAKRFGHPNYTPVIPGK